MAHRSYRRLVPPVALLLALAGAMDGCSDQIVYRDRTVFENPPTGAGNFLGYSNAEAKQTTCGNCHSGKQAQWRQTAHASAFTLVATNTAAGRPECEACHSVSSLGNLSTATDAGWVATRNTRYKDVQCESCHGPGLPHALNPDLPANKPLASLAVDTNLTRGCGECHRGADGPFLEQWRKSRHGNFNLSRATNVSCQSCHSAKGALDAWGITTNYSERGTPEQNMAITCTVCHDPHSKKNPAQLRFPVDVPDLQANLCMKCHYRRANPDPTSSQGPHSPQGPMLLGEAGWFPPNFQYPPGALVGSHGTDRNPKLCATCHLSRYTVKNPTSGNPNFRATGHSFQPIPCVGADSIPTGSTTCDLTERSFRSCTGCHLTENAARTALILARARLTRLAAEVDAMLPRIPASEFSITDNRISTGEGARFNSQLAMQPGSGAHNPFLAEALLLASIRQIELDYGLRPAASLVMEAQLAPR